MEVKLMNELNERKKKNRIEEGYLFGMVEALEVIFTKENTIFGFSTGRHTFAEIDPEIVASTFVSSDSPT
jgi:hypothetical protein